MRGRREAASRPRAVRARRLRCDSRLSRRTSRHAALSRGAAKSPRRQLRCRRPPFSKGVNAEASSGTKASGDTQAPSDTEVSSGTETPGSVSKSTDFLPAERRMNFSQISGIIPWPMSEIIPPPCNGIIRSAPSAIIPLPLVESFHGSEEPFHHRSAEPIRASIPLETQAFLAFQHAVSPIFKHAFPPFEKGGAGGICSCSRNPTAISRKISRCWR